MNQKIQYDNHEWIQLKKEKAPRLKKKFKILFDLIKVVTENFQKKS
jgi:hypothetical protein